MNILTKLKNTLVHYKSVIKTSIEVAASAATVISVVFVLLTLHEMQIQRNNAYMPDIIFEPTQVSVLWGNTEKDENPFASKDEVFNPPSIAIPSRNIGVGVAKNLTYSIDDNTFTEWLELLIELDKDNKYSYSQSGSQFVIKANDTEIMFSTKYEIDKVFLLPNAEEAFDFIIPVQYTRLLQKIYEKRGAESISIPDIKGSISYTDVQGVEYVKPITLQISDQYIFEDTDGSGSATYRITMK